jgi:chromosome segregation ATPase
MAAAKIDDLFSEDPEDFVARRDALVKQLRAEGDGEEADRVKALKKPSRVAWAVNRVSAGDAKLRRRLLDAGAALRKAQEGLMAGRSGADAVRKATEKEREAVSQAVEAAKRHAAESGSELSPAATEKVRNTLHAVALDEEVRDQFEHHRLQTDHEATGLSGFAMGSGAGGEAGAARRTKKAAKREVGKRRAQELKAAEKEAAKLEKRRADAEREAEEARAAAKRAQGDLKRATQALERAVREAEEAADRVEGLRGT